ncbi:MAG: hypothetical protein KDE27_05015 [Planctomycetes bacterium]|nr:hypothetical protein [Planctomycetota bacterium]
MSRPLPCTLVLALVFAACGGGGGGGTPVGPTARLASAEVEFGATATSAELAIALADLPVPAPTLMQVTIELPAALAVAPSDPLRAVQAVPTLQGARQGNRFVVVCGDDQNQAGTPLQNGELFRLRLATVSPRQVGTHTIVLRELVLAQNDGTEAPVDGTPVSVTAVVR